MPNPKKAKPTSVQRALGCLYGQACGDALGTTLEFASPEKCLELYPKGLSDIIGGGAFVVQPGQVTDDTEMALALARSLLREREYRPRKVREAYKRWAESHPIDIGGTTSSALRAGKLNLESEANGALMRVSPLGVFLHACPSRALAFALGSADAALTHPNKVCTDASGIFAATIAYAINSGVMRGEDANKAAFNFAVSLAHAMDAKEAIEDLWAAEKQELYPHATGHVRVAFRLAFYHLLKTPSLEEALVDTVMRGGDADTNGAIVGALLGAVRGFNAIPMRWSLTVDEAVVKRPEEYLANGLHQLAIDLIRAGAEDAGGFA
jgi:ADP-ribosylglycohydrolase